MAHTPQQHATVVLFLALIDDELTIDRSGTSRHREKSSVVRETALRAISRI
jgi:hypothetical protein